MSKEELNAETRLTFVAALDPWRSKLVPSEISLVRGESAKFFASRFAYRKSTFSMCLDVSEWSRRPKAELTLFVPSCSPWNASKLAGNVTPAGCGWNCTVNGRLRKFCSAATKKNVRSFLMCPPSAPPNWCCIFRAGLPKASGEVRSSFRFM